MVSEAVETLQGCRRLDHCRGFPNVMALCDVRARRLALFFGIQDLIQDCRMAFDALSQGCTHIRLYLSPSLCLNTTILSLRTRSWPRTFVNSVTRIYSVGFVTLYN